jgi:hypothetical protein
LTRFSRTGLCLGVRRGLHSVLTVAEHCFVDAVAAESARLRIAFDECLLSKSRAHGTRARVKPQRRFNGSTQLPHSASVDRGAAPCDADAVPALDTPFARSALGGAGEHRSVEHRSVEHRSVVRCRNGLRTAAQRDSGRRCAALVRSAQGGRSVFSPEVASLEVRNRASHGMDTCEPLPRHGMGSRSGGRSTTARALQTML